jgi:methyl-accepting chemotaxis protein
MELSSDIIIQFFFSLCGLIIAVIVVCFKFFERIITARFEKSDLQRDKKDLEQDMRIKEDIKKEIEELEKRINHMIQNIKHTNNLLMQSLEAQDNKIYKTNEILSSIQKAND